MSQAVITQVFEQWKAQQAATNEAVTLDEFVFAHVPDLDVDTPIDRNEVMPPAAQIVHRQAVSRTGVVNDNAVVYSVVLGADTGDFTFNWVGLINKASGTLAMIVHAPEQQKLKTKDGQQGNVLTRSFLMEFNGAQTETGIDTPAETWQIDFTARMTGIDERQRLENVDIYGAGAFFDNGYLVSKNGTQYFVTKGTGYVGGLRAVLAANQNITVAAKPVKVWLDVCWTGTLTSTWNVQQKITVAATHADYVLDNIQHYVFALASIDANGNITDLRPKGSLGEQQGNSNFLRKNANLSDLTDPAKACDNLRLGTAAKAALVLSSTDTTAGRVPVVGWMGLGGAEIGIADGTNIYKFFATAKSGNYGGGGNLPGCLTSGWRSFKWQQHGSDNKYGMLLEFGSDGKTALHVYHNTNGDMTNPENYWSNRGLLYGEKNKPSPANIGAVATSLTVNGHALTGNINVTSNDIFNNQAIELGKAVNLNDYKTPGIYFQSMTANAQAGSNYPEQLAGTLVVYRNASPGATQVYYVYNTSRVYVRGQYNTGAWGAWGRQYDTQNKPTAADVGALPLSGGTLSGNLTVKNQIQVGVVGNSALNIGDTDSGLRSSVDGQVDLWANNVRVGYWKSGTFYFSGQIVPNDYTNYDGRYQLKNTASKAANGWFKDTSTGIITQWGTASGGGDDQYYTVNTPIAFPNAFVSLQVYPIYPGAITSGHTLASAGKINSKSQFGYGISDGASGGVSAQGVYWIAIGY